MRIGAKSKHSLIGIHLIRSQLADVGDRTIFEHPSCRNVQEISVTPTPAVSPPSGEPNLGCQAHAASGDTEWLDGTK